MISKNMNKKILPFLVLSLAIAGLPFVANASKLGDVANNILTVVVEIAGAITFIGWIIAGILYLTSAGAPEKMNIAKKAAIAAAIGTVLVVLATGSGAIIDIIRDSIGVQ